jgi:hypothetical protein
MLTHQKVQELFDYDAESGVLTWRVTRTCKAVKGSRAGHLTKAGYRTVHINGKQYMEHRLCWLHVHGCFPPTDLDHKNRDRSDNRIENLRPATDSQNQANKGALPTNRSCGVRGVTRHKTGKWQAGITINGRRRHLGLHASVDDAAAAYRAAAEAHFGEFAR